MMIYPNATEMRNFIAELTRGDLGSYHGKTKLIEVQTVFQTVQGEFDNWSVDDADVEDPTYFIAIKELKVPFNEYIFAGQNGFIWPRIKKISVIPEAIVSQECSRFLVKDLADLVADFTGGDTTSVAEEAEQAREEESRQEAGVIAAMNAIAQHHEQNVAAKNRRCYQAVSASIVTIFATVAAAYMAI